LVELTVTSKVTGDYNCFAWAAGESDSWWGHNQFADEFWPEGVKQEMSIRAFVEAFQTRDFKVCEDESLEVGFEKIAIYANDSGIPQHAARQIANGLWTSKIGLWEDVQHQYVVNLVSHFRGQIVDYGNVAVIMKREIRTGSF